MCGILVTTKEIKEGSFKESLAYQLHRGPDYTGYSECDGIKFGHNRLSILDTSSDSNQPIEREHVVMVFNGEIYNYLELADSYGLSNKKSDTQVLVDLYLKNGIEFVYELIGMFSIVIYDRRKNGLWMIRDWFGIKPLLYHKDSDGITLSSELSALIKLNDVFELNKNYLKEFLTVGYGLSNDTVVDGVKSLPPGTIMYFNLNMNDFTAEFNYKDHVVSELGGTLSRKLKKLKHEIGRSIDIHLRSDVPFCALLSGGIDSSIVCALASENSSLHAITVSNQASDVYDESYQATDFSNRLNRRRKNRNLNHQILDSKEFDEKEILSKLDAPVSDSSIVPSYNVFRSVRDHGTVVICGDGGDELFFGYNWYRYGVYLYLFKALPRKLQTILNKKLAGKSFGYNYALRRSLVFKKEQLNEVEEKVIAEFGERVNDYVAQHGLIRGLVRLDLNYYLPKDILDKVDKSSMLNSVEARVPLLNVRILILSSGLLKLSWLNFVIKKFVLFMLYGRLISRKKFFSKKRGFNHEEKAISDDVNAMELFEKLGLQEFNPEAINTQGQEFAVKSLFYWVEKYESSLVRAVEK